MRKSSPPECLTYSSEASDEISGSLLGAESSLLVSSSISLVPWIAVTFLRQRGRASCCDKTTPEMADARSMFLAVSGSSSRYHRMVLCSCVLAVPHVVSAKRSANMDDELMSARRHKISGRALSLALYVSSSHASSPYGTRKITPDKWRSYFHSFHLRPLVWLFRVADAQHELAVCISSQRFRLAQYYVTFPVQL